MDLRITQVHTSSLENPFLSPYAANLKWLPGALREAGVALAGPAEQAPMAHVQDQHDVYPARELGQRRVATRYRNHPDRGIPSVALSQRQASAIGEDVVAVIAPALDTDALPVARETADHIAFSFDGRDEHALAAALAVAANTERPLAIVLDATAQLSETCQAAVDDALSKKWVRVSRVARNDVPEDLLNARAYLAFTRPPFDMAALTALAAGTPIVSLAGSPASELFVHGESGWACSSVEEACRAIERLDLLSPALARSRARTLFDARTAAMQYRQVFERVAAAEVVSFRHPEFDAGPRAGRPTESEGREAAVLAL